MVRVTGTVIAMSWLEYWVNVISPTYVPAARVLAFTLTVIASGVVQQATPVFAIVNQAPPLPVTAAASNVMLEPELSPVLMMLRTCGNGFAPPKGMVKLIGFTWRKTVLPTVTLTGMVTLLPAV